MFENHLKLPFETEVLGVRVTVEAIEQRDDNRIVAMCRRGKQEQAIEITELPAPKEKPAGGGVDRGVPPMAWWTMTDLVHHEAEFLVGHLAAPDERRANWTSCPFEKSIAAGW
jgi:hypothetical protein